ncbi:MAG: MFS transporter, partial [Lapillicoccus sp.]
MSTAPARPPLSSFWRDLPRAGKWLLSTVIIDFIGNGLVLPFSVVYLHEVRGFPLERVGLLLAIPAIVGLVVVGPAGVVIDRLGARGVVLSAIAVQLVSQVVLASVTTEGRAVVAMVLLGLSQGVIWPAINALVATIVPSGIRQRYYGLNFTLLNLGIGIGGLVGGLFVDVHRPSTFVTIYLVNAATFLAPLAILVGPLRHHTGRAALAATAAGVGGGDTAPRATYRTLLRDRTLLPVLALTFVAAFIGYGQLNTGLPAFGRAEAQISTQVLGWAFAANTVVIVVLQLLVLQRIEGHRRTRVLLLMTTVWAAAFVALGASGLVPASL